MATTPSAATPAPTPTVKIGPNGPELFKEGTDLVPSLRPSTAFARTQVSLKLPQGLGQPWQSFVWKVEPFRPDAAYVRRVATTLGVTGLGTPGPTLGGTGPWRLWVGEKVLAVSEADGTVLFFDPKADDGPRPPGPAQADPAGFLERMLNTMGPRLDYTPDRSWTGPFRGSSTTVYAAESLLDGSWSFAGQPDSAILFPLYPNPYDPRTMPGARIYDTDEMALLSSKGRPVELVHRPLGRLISGEIYWMDHFGESVRQLAADPQRYLRFVSGDPAGRLDLTVDADGYRNGYAWADAAPGDLTRTRSTLVPVNVFLATGTNGKGEPVSALFVSDGVIATMRRPPASRALNVDADLLMRRQLTLSVGGHRPQMAGPTGAIEDVLGPVCAASAAQTMVDSDTANATATCNGATTVMTLKRAFPGLSGSVWYVSESHK